MQLRKLKFHEEKIHPVLLGNERWNDSSNIQEHIH